MAFPTSIDSPKLNWIPGETRSTHSAQHNMVATLLIALQNKIGIDGSANTNSIDYKVGLIDGKADLAGSITQPFAVEKIQLGHLTDTIFERVSPGVASLGGITLSQTLLPTINTDSATITFNLASNNKHKVTITNNRVLALSNTTNVPVFTINIKQDAIGSRTVTWFSGISWAGGITPTLTTTPNKEDSFGFQQISSGVYLGCIIFKNA